MDVAPTLYVMVGLPGAGKTTRARQLEVSNRALRLTPDEWMLPLFGDADADGKRDVLEGRLISLAIRGLRLGISVILDFGAWSRDERSALRWLADQAGARCELVYLEVTGAQQRRRTETRFAAEGGFDLADEELDEFRAMFQPPGHDELSNGSIDAAPGGYETWESWAVQRWPSFVP